MEASSRAISGVEAIVLFFLIAAIIERFVEMTTSWWIVPPDDNKKQAIKTCTTFLAGSTLGVTICTIGKLNVFAALGIATHADNINPFLYYLLSGFAIGSGTQFLHDWVALTARRKNKLKMDMEKKVDKPEHETGVNNRASTESLYPGITDNPRPSSPESPPDTPMFPEGTPRSEAS